jgi:hypothetical protein
LGRRGQRRGCDTRDDYHATDLPPGSTGYAGPNEPVTGHFPELEEQMCALTWSGYQGPGSPDRLDAMVWAMTELFEKGRALPSVRAL